VNSDGFVEHRHSAVVVSQQVEACINQLMSVSKRFPSQLRHCPLSSHASSSYRPETKRANKLQQQQQVNNTDDNKTQRAVDHTHTHTGSRILYKTCLERKNFSEIRHIYVFLLQRCHSGETIFFFNSKKSLVCAFWKS
jgi:hypothetical protein